MTRTTDPLTPADRRRPIAIPVATVVAMAFLLAGCVGAGPTSVATTAALPAGAPRVIAPERPSSEGDHARLVAAFGGEVQAPRANAVLTEITERLVRATDRPDQHYEITILDSPVANAFALPSGRLYVTRGLLALANDTSEVAGVLAHEISHVTLSHAAARTELALRSALVTRVVQDVLRDAQAGSELKNRSQVAFASFSRSQELEADQVGVRTLVRAGFDPYGAVRFLETLNRNATLRSTALGDKGGAPDMLATHPGTPERIALARDAARRAGSPGVGASDRPTYLAAIDGLAYGDNPQDGLVRGRRFLHPRLGITFEAPEGILLENTASAVVGGSGDGDRRLLFDAVEARPDQGLDEVLRSTWNDPLAAVETTSVNGNAAALATSRGGEFVFRMAAVRAGEKTFRLILAGRPGSDPEPAFRRTLASLRPLGAEEARAVAPLRLAVVTAAPGDTVERLASRMALTERAAERFRVLNGLDRGESLTPGERYKLVVD